MKDEDPNPYSASPLPQLETGSGRGRVLLFAVVTIVTAVCFGLFPVEEFPVRKFVQDYLVLGMAILFLPAVAWELLCRKTERGQSRSESVARSAGRCFFLYLWAFLIAQYLFSSLAGPKWTNGDGPVTDAMKVMYLKHGIANGMSVIVAVLLLVAYDMFRSKRVEE